MQCTSETCNHSLAIDKKRLILAAYPSKGKVDMVCMFVGESHGEDPDGKPICVVLPGWKGSCDNLVYSSTDRNCRDVEAAAAVEQASKSCPIDVLFISKGSDTSNFQFLLSLIKAVRALHPRMCVFSAMPDSSMAVKYIGDETDEEKAIISLTGNRLIRDLDIATRVVN